MKINRRKIHKRHFQLLELMCAIFILLICLAPAMRIFTNVFVSTQGMAKTNMRDHLAHWAHAMVVEKLYKREISFKKGEDHSIALTDPDFNEKLQKNGLNFKGTLSIDKSYTPRNSEHPHEAIAKLIMNFEDARPATTDRAPNDKGKNNDASDSEYDYLIYINSEEKSSSDRRSAGQSEKAREQSTIAGSSARNDAHQASDESSDESSEESEGSDDDDDFEEDEEDSEDDDD